MRFGAGRISCLRRGPINPSASVDSRAEAGSARLVSVGDVARRHAACAWGAAHCGVRHRATAMTVLAFSPIGRRMRQDQGELRMRIAVVVALFPLAAVMFTSPSYARPADQQEQSKKKARDPNETVCETEEVLGSRLATRRVCMTRAQWAEKRRDDRALVDRSQTQLCVASGGECSRGN